MKRPDITVSSPEQDMYEVTKLDKYVQLIPASPEVIQKLLFKIIHSESVTSEYRD
jgi:hypothetical protein